MYERTREKAFEARIFEYGVIGLMIDGMYLRYGETVNSVAWGQDLTIIKARVEAIWYGRRRGRTIFRKQGAKGYVT